MNFSRSVVFSFDVFILRMTEKSFHPSSHRVIIRFCFLPHRLTLSRQRRKGGLGLRHGECTRQRAQWSVGLRRAPCWFVYFVFFVGFQCCNLLEFWEFFLLKLREFKYSFDLRIVAWGSGRCSEFCELGSLREGDEIEDRIRMGLVWISHVRIVLYKIQESLFQGELFGYLRA